MSPDDPRHGTQAGYQAHIRAGIPTCQPCRNAKNRQNQLRLANGGKVPAVGSRRRIQALHAIGYPRRHIQGEIGMSDSWGALWHVMEASTTHVTRATEKKIRDVYDRLCMTPGPSSSARIRAQSRGWPPPLAWDDDIDDPAAEPQGLVWQSGRDENVARRIDELETALLAGHRLARILADTGLERESLRRWLDRHGRLDLWERLARRDEREVA